MGDKQHQDTDPPVELRKIESSMTMARFAGLKLRLDTPKGTDLPCLAAPFPFPIPVLLPSRDTEHSFHLSQSQILSHTRELAAVGVRR